MTPTTTIYDRLDELEADFRRAKEENDREAMDLIEAEFTDLEALISEDGLAGVGVDNR